MDSSFFSFFLSFFSSYRQQASLSNITSMWIQPPLLVLLGFVAISAAMAIKKEKITKKHNNQHRCYTNADCADSSCYCKNTDCTDSSCYTCAPPSDEHHCPLPPPTADCYYQSEEVSDVEDVVLGGGCDTIVAQEYNRKCNEIVAYDEILTFAFYNCVDSDKPDGTCANSDVCRYKKNNYLPTAVVEPYGGCYCSQETALVDCPFSCFCTPGDKPITYCAAPSTEHHCPSPTTKCYYQTLDWQSLWVNDIGCSGILAAMYNRECSKIVAYDRTRFAYFNCVDSKEPNGICADLEVCKYNEDNSPPQGQ